MNMGSTRQCAGGIEKGINMKRILLAGLLAAAVVPAFGADIGVSISINQPGLYGRIDIGDVPQPQVIYSRPVVVERAPRPAVVRPIYLHVPPGYEKHWSRHCHEYHACGEPVYFVREDWYRNVYMRHHRERREKRDMHRDERRDRRIERDRRYEHDRGRDRERRDRD
jgi:hypothetical protein